MTTGWTAGDEVPPPAPWLSRACEHFERAWRAGQRPRPEDHLGDLTEPERSLLLRELLRRELAFRHGDGERPTADEYARRFPDLGPWLGALLGLAPTTPGPPTAAGLTAGPATRVQSGEAATWTHSPGEHPSAASGPPALPGYDILGEVGRGGMGIVYRARDLRRGQDVALKVMAQVSSASLYRFKQEFRALADVAHPNLVQLYELVAHGPLWFFTMEFVEGAHFLAHVRPGFAGAHPAATESLVRPPSDAAPGPVVEAPGAPGLPFQESRLREALRQLGEGLCALHAAGKLHRDVKPSNVLVSRAGRVVIVDFGLAAELDHHGLYAATEQHFLGTVAYVSPEQAAGDAVSPASDWYSVGVMLYEALTGQLPFRGRALHVLREKERRDPAPPRDLVPGIPEDLAALCAALLRRNPAERPSGRDVLDCLGGNATAAAVPVPPPTATPLVGRERHLQALDDAFAAAGRGRAVVVGVRGRSGAGKSSLLHCFLDGLAARGGVVVLAGRCYEQESVPYKALDSLIDALSQYLGRLPPDEAAALLPADVTPLARVFPVLRRVRAVAEAPHRAGAADPQEVRRRAFAALRQLLARLGARKHLVLAIDDLQWGDVDSAALLAELLRPPDAPALLLLACYRSEEVDTSPFLGAFLPALDRAGDGLDRRAVTVEALTPDEARDLSLALFGRGGPAARARAEAVARESGGNPLFVHELVQNLQAGGPSPGEAISLDEVLWARVRRLPDEARRVLEALAVAAGPLDQGLACRVAGLADGRGALAQLRAGRLVRSTGSAERGDIETYHDRVRETVVAHLPAEARRDYHRGLALALEAAGRADAESLAQHFQGAGESARAGEYYARAAGQAAEALAFDRAAKLYRLALELCPLEGEERRRLRTQLAHALANAGRGTEAAHEYQASAEGAPAAEALDLRRLAAMYFLISGRIDQGLSVMRTVLRAVGLWWPPTPRLVLGSLLLQRARLWLRGLHFRERTEEQIPADELTRIDVSWSAAVGLTRVHTLRGAELQARHMLLALRGGEPYRVARALALEAAHSATGGVPGYPRAQRLLAAARAINGRVAHPHTIGLERLISGVSEYLCGRWRKGLGPCEEAARILHEQCTGVMWELNTARAYVVYILYFMGEIAEMARRLPALLADAAERGNLFVLANHGTFSKPLVQLAADEPEAAGRDLDGLMAQWSQQGFQAQHFYSLCAHTHIDLYRGDAESAWRRVRAEWPALAASLLLRVQHVRIFSHECRARAALAMAARAADPGPFLAVAERDVRRLEPEQVPYPDALARLLRAGLAAVRRDHDATVSLLREAVDGLEAVEMRLYAAAARRRLGELVGGDEGRALIGQADAWLAAQGVRDAGRMAAMLTPSFL